MIEGGSDPVKRAPDHGGVALAGRRGMVGDFGACFAPCVDEGPSPRPKFHPAQPARSPEAGVEIFMMAEPLPACP